ncbi:TetR/AcrR family transcriptional regulator [Amycolatopsis echigonensis]|uniref:TetR/AcrR family transcriptional regulator n=1 Tax=Amycolatopsis echigonensis TaxID=2576905 RepID=A0A8E1W696_9PSEU|nr:TetR/AcrR family transcriptional regulator [Amycolatopsis echigonensis]MBB2505148.1 TetR/AcrR family transcriptional regulator [Amycolatopsis echigonensis]
MPEPPTRPRLRARYNERRDAVLQTAAKVYAERGYHATSMNELISATGLTAGGLYHYIESKERLLFSLFDQLMTPLLEQANAILETADRPEKQLRALVRVWLEHVEKYRHHMIVFQQEWRTLQDDPRWLEVRKQRRAFEDILRGLFDRMAADGVGPADPELARRALLAMVNSTAEWLDPDGPRTAHEIADAYSDLIIGKTRRKRATPATATSGHR